MSKKIRKEKSKMLKIGSHVGMSGKDMFVNSVKEAISYDANTFMVYTGAPQNTRRKSIEELHIPEATTLRLENGIEDFVVHAPYIINLGNSVKEETFQLAVDFLRLEIERCASMGSKILILHPGSHVGEGVEKGIKQIVYGLNQVLTKDTPCYVTLETMSGKGSEIGSTFKELAAIYDGVIYNNKLRVCMDTCHMHDSGYDISNHFDDILNEFDSCIGISQIAAIHVNDSKNPLGAKKDRHENLGKGYIGFDAISRIVHHPALENIPKILETPYITDPSNPSLPSVAPYKEEIAMLRANAPKNY